MSNPQITCITPIDGSIYTERPLASDRQIADALAEARDAQAIWKNTPIAERQALLSAAVDAFVAQKAQIAEEITWQMGRPLSQTPGEINGFEERARHMIAIAPQALADLQTEPRPGFERFIRREPLGVVFVVAPWNYPYLTAVNAVVPALMAGNAVLLKHSAQTPLCAERFNDAFMEAGLPYGLFQPLHLNHQQTHQLIADEIDYVNFTGSVAGGRAVQQAAAKRFIGAGLELGGKDPAYVRPDADIEYAVSNVVDGAFFNSGQSCCGIERVYVHRDVYQKFVDGAVELTKTYRLGNPLEASSNLGPMVRTSAAEFVRGQIGDALGIGAKALIDENAFSENRAGTPYLAPQILVDVDHSMRVMSEESFGPVVGIMAVDNDDDAIALMNDSAFGLTASIWTTDQDAAIAIGERVNTGTWFMNRCDYLDPALAWTGVKDSGRGCSLSVLGYEALTRPKSFHLKTRL